MHRILAAFALLCALLLPKFAFAAVPFDCTLTTATQYTCTNMSSARQAAETFAEYGHNGNCTAATGPAVYGVLRGTGNTFYKKWTCGSPPTTGSNGGQVGVATWTQNDCAVRAPRYGGWQPAGGVACDRGCEMRVSSTPLETERVDSAAGTSINVRANYEPTGNACGSDMPEAKPKDDYCTLLPMGHKICRDNKGRQCVISGTTGRKYCSADGQTPLNATNPERTENATSTGPKPAPGIPTTPTTPRPGEDFRETATAKVTNVTNNTVNNVSLGSNAGTPNTNPGDGNPGDGSDNPGEGGGDEGEKGSAGGGSDCNAPPTCSGDPIACAVLEQTWRNRCGNSKGDENGDGRPDWTELAEGEGSDGPEPGNGDEVAKTWGMESLLDKVDDSGFIGQSCLALPTFDVGPLGSYDVGGEWWCEALDVIGNVFVFIASCVAIRTLVS